jgi:PAT family beta-lactamase induction signal transducer AmpG
MLTGNTLNFWLAKLGLDLKIIGLSSLIALPYVLKYCLAPFIEKYSLYKTRKRKSWLCVLALLILISGFLLGNSNPIQNFHLTAIFGFCLALCAVSIDIILDAYRIDFSQANQNYGKTSSNFVVGYKIGMLISSSGAIMLSILIEWSSVYLIFSIFISLLLLVFVKFLPNESQNDDDKDDQKQSLLSIFLLPMRYFQSKKDMLIVLTFVVTYKIADQYILSMINPFLLHLNYNEYEISFVVKTCGALGSIAGGILGGHLINKFGARHCLFYFAILHSSTNMLFIIQEHIGYNLLLLYTLTLFGTISSGMTMCVYIAYVMKLCSGSYSGTKYAFYSSLMGLSRVLLPAPSGYIVDIFGWDVFFLLMLLLTMPGILVTKWLPYQK